MALADPLHARPKSSPSSLVIVQVHKTHLGPSVLIIVYEPSRELDTVVNVLGAATPLPLPLLLPFRIVTVAFREISLGTGSRDGPG